MRKAHSIFLALLLFTTQLFAQDDVMLFAENKGQWNSNVKYCADLNMGKVYLESNKIDFLIHDFDHFKHAHDVNDKKDLVNCHFFKIAFTGANATSIVVNPTSTMQYTVTGTLNNVCYESEVVNVTVNQLPNVTFNQNPTTVCMGVGLVPLNGLPTGGAYVGNGVTGSNFNAGNAGNGTHQIVYTYTDANNCVNSATATMIVDPCAGLNENVIAQNISIYPVPATDHVVIKFASAHDELQVSIYNAIGQVVSQKAIAKGIQNYKLETSEYARGVYFLKVKTSEQTKFVKFVLE